MDAFALDVPVSDIQALGRWRSQAFIFYVRSGARALRAAYVESHRRRERAASLRDRVFSL